MTADTERATLVAYMPADVLSWEVALEKVEGLLVRAPVAHLLAAGGR